MAMDYLLNYDKMPKCIYTHPEVASIGYNKESAEAKNIKTKSFKVSFNAIGKAVIDKLLMIDDFVK